jgi:hypothetical protein
VGSKRSAFNDLEAARTWILNDSEYGGLIGMPDGQPTMVVRSIYDQLSIDGVKLDDAHKNLEGGNFWRASLSFSGDGGLRFANANLEQATLYYGRLSGCDFTGANLTSAHLFGAMLRGSRFAGANLANATFQDAHLSECDFTGANIHGTVGLIGVSGVGRHLKYVTIYWYKGEAIVIVSPQAGMFPLGGTLANLREGDEYGDDDEERAAFAAASAYLRTAFDAFMRRWRVGKYAG